MDWWVITLAASGRKGRFDVSESDWTQAFAEEARKRLRATGVPGAAFGVVQDGRVVAQGGYGYRDRANSLRATPNTVFGVGSCTKSLTALAILQLQEKGLLSTPDPVTRWLPALKLGSVEHTRQVTIHHLLTHTSGLPPLPSLFYVAARSMQNDPSLAAFPLLVDLDQVFPVETFDGLIRLLGELDYQVLGLPGKYFSYSNDGYGLLGAIIERASGETYRDYMRSRLLEPMGLKSTTFDVDGLDRFAEVTQLYSSQTRNGRRRVFATPGWWKYFATEPAVGLLSNVHDMLRYLEVFSTGGVVGGHRIVSEESLQQLMAPHIEISNMPGRYYGYGVIVQPDYHGMTVIEHGGGSKGVDAHFMCVPGQAIGLTVLANLVGSASKDVARLLLNSVTGLPLETPRLEFPHNEVPVHQLGSFAGHYATAEGAEVDFIVRDSSLVARLRGKPVRVRFFAEDGAVIQAGEGMPVRFLCDGDQRVFAVAMGLRVYPKVGSSRENH